eukprot:COSAG03_NODE_11229_length_604_cov_0.990099_1_plen_25_part_01
MPLVNKGGGRDRALTVRVGPIYSSF